jgi:hypothetical protein
VFFLTTGTLFVSSVTHGNLDVAALEGRGRGLRHIPGLLTPWPADMPHDEKLGMLVRASNVSEEAANDELGSLAGNANEAKVQVLKSYHVCPVSMPRCSRQDLWITCLCTCNKYVDIRAMETQ